VRWNLLLLLAVLLTAVFSFSVISADEPSVELTTIQNEVHPYEDAGFSLTINNNNDKTQRYTIFTQQAMGGWSVSTSPLNDRIITIAPSGSYTTAILARALEEFTPGIYNLPVIIEGDQGDHYSLNLKIYLRPENSQRYVPTLKVSVDMVDRFKPTDTVPIKLQIENKNRRDLTEMVVRIESEMNEFNKEVQVDLEPLGKKTIDFSVIPSLHQQPKEYKLFFVFEIDGEVIKIVEKKVEVLSLLPEFDVSINSEETIFLKKFMSVTVENNGNVRNTQEAVLPLHWWEKIFAKGDEAKQGKVGDASGLVWELSLGPGEEKTFNTVVNYRIPLYLAIIILALLIFYYSVKSPIVVIKTATRSSSNDAGLSEIKVTLEIHNRTLKPLKHVEIIDTVPAIANVQRSLDLGSLRPQEIRHLQTGTKVTWALAEIDAHEHRLITYKVRAKLNILGTFSLPRVIVSYAKGKGKKGKAYSNMFRLRA